MNANHRAFQIQSTLGTRVAAGYLRNQGYTVEEAVFLLARRG